MFGFIGASSRRHATERFLTLLFLACVVTVLSTGCHGELPTVSPKAQTPTVESKKSALTNDFPHTDQYIVNLQALAYETNRIRPWLESMLSNVEKAQEVVDKAIDIAEKIKKIDKILATIEAPLEVLSVVPTIKTVTNPIKSQVSSMRSTLNNPKKAAVKALKILKPTKAGLDKLAPTLKHLIEALTTMHSAARGHAGQMSYLKNCADGMSGALRSSSIASLEGYSQVNNVPLTAMNTALQAIQLDSFGLDLDLPTLTSLLESINLLGLGSVLKALEAVVAPFENILNELEGLLDRQITVNVGFDKFRFSVKKILNGLNIINEAMDLLMQEVRKLIDPLLDKLGVNWPSLPNLSGLTNLFDGLSLNVSNPLSWLWTSLDQWPINSFLTTLKEWLKLINIGLPTTCTKDIFRLTSFKYPSRNACMTATAFDNTSYIRLGECNLTKQKHRWEYYPLTNELRLAGTDKCLTAKSKSGEWLTMTTCTAGDTLQKWVYRPYKKELRLAANGRCVGLRNPGDNKSHLILQSCDNSSKQEALIKPADVIGNLEEKPFRLKFEENGKCVKPNLRYSKEFIVWRYVDVIKQFEFVNCSNSADQKWTYSPATGQLKHVQSGDVLNDGQNEALKDAFTLDPGQNVMSMWSPDNAHVQENKTMWFYRAEFKQLKFDMMDSCLGGTISKIYSITRKMQFLQTAGCTNVSSRRYTILQ